MANIINAHSQNARPLKPFGSKVKRNEKNGKTIYLHEIRFLFS